jgi:hypothetical protein
MSDPYADCERIDVSIIRRNVLRFRLMLLRLFHVPKRCGITLRDSNTLQDVSFEMALALQMLLMLSSIDGDDKQCQSIHLARPAQRALRLLKRADL